MSTFVRRITLTLIPMIMVTVLWQQFTPVAAQSQSPAADPSTVALSASRLIKWPKASPTSTSMATATPVSSPPPSISPTAVQTTTPTPTSNTSSNTRLYGVLQGNNQYLTSDWNAGTRLRTLEIGWDYYEPQQGSWNTAYIQQQQMQYSQMVGAGYKVVLDLGMQYPPAWAKNIQPWRDQYGNSFSNQVNAVWSTKVRDQIAIYIQHVFQDLGTGFYGVRLGSGGFVETLYPDNLPGFQFSYWAFDPDALTTNPVPTWKPGQPSPNGEAQIFYNWYLQSLIDTVNWQQAQVRSHFGGYLIQLLPGQGVRPTQLQTLIASNLIPIGKNIYGGERGAVWDKIVDGMQNRVNVILDCSSVGDSSATSPYTNETGTDPVYWSSAHWVAYNADRYGLGKMAESPGRNDYATMQVVFKQVAQFGYTTLFWAFESDLYDGLHATLAQYASMITQYH